jgi:hypothetical protein
MALDGTEAGPAREGERWQFAWWGALAEDRNRERC